MATTSPSAARIGLALAGGGPLGAVYEIGALRALEEALDGVDLTAVDRYVGVSAGSFVAASLANGIAPAELVRMLVRHQPGEIPFDASAFFEPALVEWARRGLRLPRLVAESLWGFVARPREHTMGMALSHLSRALPVGLFENEPIRRYVHALLTRPGRTDDFRVLRQRGRDLVIVSADLGAGRAVRLGGPGWEDVPISRAVQASTAVPGFYTPVRIRGRYHVDGAVLKTVHASVLLEKGVDLLLVVNPIVPIDTTSERRRDAVREPDLVEEGLPMVLSQTVRAVLDSRMRATLARYRHHAPTTDVLLFEPGRDEYGLFFAPMFSFHARERICALAYVTTLRDLRRRRARLAPRLARHGITLRDDVLSHDADDLWRGVGLRPGRGHPPGARRRDDGAEERRVARERRALPRRVTPGSAAPSRRRNARSP
ncbi:MAG TPA: patatin-like phospholipase family protein [Gemmatimonadaceae bacterium]|nr:patatin-like phospholipase family protein [Gemmatimonadaceae bacterium]